MTKNLVCGHSRYFTGRLAFFVLFERWASPTGHPSFEELKALKVALTHTDWFLHRTSICVSSTIVHVRGDPWTLSTKASVTLYVARRSHVLNFVHRATSPTTQCGQAPAWLLSGCLSWCYVGAQGADVASDTAWHVV